MKKRHVKSSCCGAPIVRHGERRRRCTNCRRTWSVRKKKPGRKHIRVHAVHTSVAFSSNETLRHKACRTGVGRETVRRRHVRTLETLVRQLPAPQAPKGDLLLLIDAKGFVFSGTRYTLHVMLLRPINSVEATIMDPVLLPEWETIQSWKHVIETLPFEVRSRIRAYVSDGLPNIQLLSTWYGWAHQRCHFHLIASFYRFRGRRWGRIQHKELREAIYQNILHSVRTKDETEVVEIINQLKATRRDTHCPSLLALRTQGFLRNIASFRTYQRYPELKLPTTNNACESVMRLIDDMQRQARGFTTIQSFKKWLTVLLRKKGSIKCRW